jgi:hypothetical protein
MTFAKILWVAGVLLLAATVAPGPLSARHGDGQAPMKPMASRPPARPHAGPLPPLPYDGYGSPRPMEITHAVYEFAARHPEVLQYVPCFCGCERNGHTGNESCFVKSRDGRGQVTAWDSHGFG